MRHLLLAALVSSLLCGADARADDTVETATSPIERAEMIYQIEFQALYFPDLLGTEGLDVDVLLAMGKVPRHLFVPPELAALAYRNRPLPVTSDQNIAQPFIIALMTDQVEIGPEDVVFETGTGAGYHAALLAELAGEVYSMDIDDALVRRARRILDRLAYKTVHLRSGDGYYGWPEAGPFDAIIVKEAVDHLPPPLVDQLKVGGRMIAPIGPDGGSQWLTLAVKQPDGSLVRRNILQVTFTPLQGGDRI